MHSFMEEKKIFMYPCIQSNEAAPKNQGRIESNDKARGHVSMKTNNGTFFLDILIPSLDFEA